MTDRVKELKKEFYNINEYIVEEVGKIIVHRDIDMCEWDDGSPLEDVFDFDLESSSGWGNGLKWKVSEYLFEIVDEFGGMDEGSSYWGVAKVSKDGQEDFFIKVDGWYASHHGGDCDDYEDWREVSPKEKTTIEYVDVE